MKRNFWASSLLAGAVVLAAGMVRAQDRRLHQVCSWRGPEMGGAPGHLAKHELLGFEGMHRKDC